MCRAVVPVRAGSQCSLLSIKSGMDRNPSMLVYYSRNTTPDDESSSTVDQKCKTQMFLTPGRSERRRRNSQHSVNGLCRHVSSGNQFPSLLQTPPKLPLLSPSSPPAQIQEPQQDICPRFAVLRLYEAEAI